MSGAIATGVAVAGLGAVASTLVGRALFKDGKPAMPEAPAAPAVIAPTAIPTADAALVEEARKKSLLEQSVRSGRSSTILSDTSDKLGG